MTTKNEPIRCAWVSNDEDYMRYHDEEWGRPVTDDKLLFEKLCLDGQQAGLSWLTILKKQGHYRKVFYAFEPDKIVTMTSEDIERLMQDKGIIRNRLKINAIIANAKAFLKITQSQTFCDYIWQFTDHKTQVNSWASLADVPVSTEASKAMTKQLKKDGFMFVGDTICYAFMQAVGMVNDHTQDCHCYQEVKAIARI